MDISMIIFNFFHVSDLHQILLHNMICCKILVILLITKCSAALLDSPCFDMSIPENSIYKQSTPYGNLSAGNFKKISHIENLSDCVYACCKDKTCHIAFLHNVVCFSLQCHSYEFCKPLKRYGRKYKKSFMVLIRQPEEKLVYHADHIDSDRENNLFTNDFSETGVEKSQDMQEDVLGDFLRAIPKPCIFGVLNQCPENEHCTTINTRSRTGTCHCEEKYQRDLEGICKKKPFVISHDPRITTSPATVLNQGLSLTANISTKFLTSTASPRHPLVVSAGDNVTLQLPENEVTLSAYALKQLEGESGNYKYEWTLISHPEGDETGTMQDQNTKNLKLSKLRAGLYTFKVAVSSDNAFGEAMVNVTVLTPERANKPPIAIIQPSNATVKLPNKDTVLDGSFSTDDDKIVRYQWEVLEVPIGYSVQLNETPTLQLKNLIPGLYRFKGPKPAVFEETDSAIAKVTGLIPGYYQFKLSVFDDRSINSSATVNITVIQTENMPPRANAGGDKTIYLPCDVVKMNGSASSDDAGIVKYQWTRDPASLAAGSIIEETDQSPILKLTALIPGRYLFRLTVSDLQGASSSDTASLIVKSPKTIIDQVEMVINADIKSFTQQQEDTLLRQLEILLHDADSVKVHLIKLDSDRQSRRVVLTFTVERTSNPNSGTIPGVDVVSRLKKKLRTDSSLLDVQVLLVDTVVCQNKCSGHGTCDSYTKHCVCEAFWMQDIFRNHFGDGESNCDWSILYVIIVSFIIVVSFAGLFWSFTCCLSRMRFPRPKKRHRYTLLNDINEREKFFPQGKIKKNGLFLSDSESDAIFESQAIPLTIKSNNHHNELNRNNRSVTT